MIIKSCDGSVAPPPCMHTHTHTLTHTSCKKEKKKVSSRALPISRCKKGVRGEAPFSTKKHVSAGALWPFPYTLHNPNRRPAPPEFLRRHSGPLAPGAFLGLIFWWRQGVGSAESKNVVEEEEEEERVWGASEAQNHTHEHMPEKKTETEICLLQSVFLSVRSLAGFFLFCWFFFFFNGEDKCEALGHYCLDI